MITFPYTARYFIQFEAEFAGLTPVFVYFKSSIPGNATLTDVTPPAIVEVGDGTYYFDWTWNVDTNAIPYVLDPDIIYQVDGDTTELVITDERDRFKSGKISPQEFATAYQVWAQETYPGSGETRDAQLLGLTDGVGNIGSSDDDEWARSLFGAIIHARMDIKGDPNFNNSELPWTDVGGNNIKEVYDRIGNPALAWLSFHGDGPGQLTTVVEMLQATWDRAAQLKEDILGGESTYGEDWLYGPNLYVVSGASIVNGDPTYVDFAYENSVKYISENLGGGGGSSVDYVLRAMVQRALGLLHENSVLDQTAFTGGNLGSARLRLYDTAENATAAQAASNLQPPVEYDTGKIAVYSIRATYTGANLKDYLVTLDWAAEVTSTPDPGDSSLTTVYPESLADAPMLSHGYVLTSPFGYGITDDERERSHYYTIVSDADRDVEITVRRAGDPIFPDSSADTDIDSMLWLYDENWTPLVFNDDATWPNGIGFSAPLSSTSVPDDAYWSYLKVHLQEGEIYRIEVSDYGAGAAYDLGITPGAGVTVTRDLIGP